MTFARNVGPTYCSVEFRERHVTEHRHKSCWLRTQRIRTFLLWGVWPALHCDWYTVGESAPDTWIGAGMSFRAYLDVMTLPVIHPAANHFINWAIEAYLSIIIVIIIIFSFLLCPESAVVHNIKVGMKTRYGLDGPGIESLWGRDLPHSCRPALGPTGPPLQLVPGVKRPGLALTAHPI